MTLYSGGGYIAKSRLASSYSKRRKPLRITNNRQNGYNRRIPRRFNEELETTSQKSLNSKRAMSRGIGYRHRDSLQQNLQTLNPPEEDKLKFKNKVINQIDKMTEEEIDRISKQIDEITQADNEHKAEVPPQFENEPANEEAEVNQELEDQVDPLVYQHYNNKSVTELSETGSKVRDTASRGSKRSSKSYIMKLRQELQSEREQRHKLESEIEELKRISSEISSKLGIRP